jgi:ribosomal protein S11
MTDEQKQYVVEWQTLGGRHFERVTAESERAAAQEAVARHASTIPQDVEAVEVAVYERRATRMDVEL